METLSVIDANPIARFFGFRAKKQPGIDGQCADFGATIARIRQMIEAGAISFNFENLLRVQYSRWVRPGDTVFDVGAHTGKHLEHFIALVGKAGKVVAFEPLPLPYTHIAERFSQSNVKIHNVALSDAPGQSEFVFAEGTPEESGLRQRIYNLPELARPTKIQVNVETLDSYIGAADAIRFIKIDIEGAEILCLRGASRLIEKFRPVISVEYGFPGYSVYGNTKDTLFDLATRYGYCLFDLFGNRLDDRETWHLACDSIYWDYFMVPNEKRDEFEAVFR